ncbi:hypothetical protein [Dokdonella soli]|uniref:hypothetical protein n=1 Tax=Dokdonella soli TaxID=529810 RepID=UPI0036D33D24
MIVHVRLMASSRGITIELSGGGRSERQLTTDPVRKFVTGCCRGINCLGTLPGDLAFFRPLKDRTYHKQ